MSNKVYMYCFDNSSESGSEIAKRLEIKKIKHQNSAFPGGPGYTVINWGASKPPLAVCQSKVINKPEAVARAINKKIFFEVVGDQARCVPWTTNPEVAKQWLAEGSKVVCRKQVKGYEGQGIEIVG